MTLVVNLFAGPGAGKSTTAAGVFHKIKLALVNAELVTEYAKDLTWEKRFDTLRCQAYVFGKQLQRMERVRGQVDVIVTDSPLLLSALYTPADYPWTFGRFVQDMAARFDNLNYFVDRVKPYFVEGRNQSETQARDIDRRVCDYLRNEGVDFTVVQGDETAVDVIAGTVLRRLGRIA